MSLMDVIPMTLKRWVPKRKSETSKTLIDTESFDYWESIRAIISQFTKMTKSLLRNTMFQSTPFRVWISDQMISTEWIFTTLIIPYYDNYLLFIKSLVSKDFIF